MSASDSDCKRVPKIVSIDGGTSVKPFGIDMHILIGSAETGGEFSAISAVHEPGKGPIHHRHQDQDEYLLIIEGTYQVTINRGTPQIVGPGTLIYVPRNNVHSFINVGSTPGKVVDWSLPGGQDRYFQEISDLQAGAGFDGGRMDEVNRRYDTEYLK